MKFFLLLTLVLCLGALAASERSIVAHRRSLPHSWARSSREVARSHPLSFTILLKQRNLDKLDALFNAISDPTSPQYRQFLSKEQVDALVRPEEHVFEDFKAWISQFPKVETEFRADLINVHTDVQTAEQMLETSFSWYHSTTTKKQLLRSGNAVTLPAYLAKHVDLVVGVSEFFQTAFRNPFGNTVIDRNAKVMHAVSSEVTDDPVITPSLLKNYYDVPADMKGTNPASYQGIAAFDDYFSYGAYLAFVANQSIPQVAIKRIGKDCKPNCDQYESDLDLQYLTAMGENIPTLFLAQPNNYWILQFTDDALNQTTLPSVFSISYGWSELEQCTIAVENCQSLGYNSKTYVARTNTNFQKLGTRGVSVLVSDGDDGSSSLGAATGNCPIDPAHYCPVGGCAHTTTSCPSFTIVDKSGNKCFFPMGIGSTVCGPMLNDNSLNDAVSQFLTQNAACNANIEQDVEQNPHFFSTCTCDQIVSVQTTNYTIQKYVFDPKNGALFVADYPTSSPYVTSVGATQFLSQNGQLTEVGASILTGAVITTGGGFSAFQPAQPYQRNAVQQYLGTGILPPPFSYNVSYRAYPDVSFNGHNYLIFYSNSSTDQCPCPSTVVDGTSASSPAFAGLVSLLNDQLLNAGKKTLGFLNPLLYKMYAEDQATFMDITLGNNFCNRAYCCQYGYTACPGWDPVSGLGTPNFQEILNYVLNM